MKGLELSEAFYREVLAPIINPVPHGAALIGEGSEVLGFDSERSHDHAWGPRAQIFVAAPQVSAVQENIAAELPESFRGFPTKFFRWQTNQVEHHVEVSTLGDWLRNWMGFDPSSEQMDEVAWLTTPQQLLLEVTQGRVFHDPDETLRNLRERLRWYPRDVWLTLMARQWHGVAEVEPFVGRTAEAGDELGAAFAAAKLSRAVVRLRFLQERAFCPYDKWVGTAFEKLAGAEDLQVELGNLVSAKDFPAREAAMLSALRIAAKRHNKLGLTEPLDTATGPFQVGVNDAVRPFEVLNAMRFAKACIDAISDVRLRKLAAIGSVDQLLEMTDTLVHFSDWPLRLRTLYSETIR